LFFSKLKLKLQNSNFSPGITVFLTFSVSAVRIASSIPTQSEYLPPIIAYFMLSQLFTLTAFAWFTVDNVLRAEAYIPGFMTQFGRMLRFVASSVLRNLRKAKRKILRKSFKKEDEYDLNNVNGSEENITASVAQVF
jgi:hypothetical protein